MLVWDETAMLPLNIWESNQLLDTDSTDSESESMESDVPDLVQAANFPWRHWWLMVEVD